MNLAQSRQFGRVLMVVSALQLLLFTIGMMRRSYLAVALPVLSGLTVVSTIAFWIGYTMATAEWDDEDFEGPAAPPPGAAAPGATAQGAPPPAANTGQSATAPLEPPTLPAEGEGPPPVAPV